MRPRLPAKPQPAHREAQIAVPRQIALAERMRAAGEPVPEIAKTLGVSRPTMYRLLEEKNNGG